MTWTGASRHSATVSWFLVGAFAAGAVVMGRVTATRLRRVFARPSTQMPGSTDVLGATGFDR